MINNSEDTIYYKLSYNNDSIGEYPVRKIDNKVVYAYSYIIKPKDKVYCVSMDKWEVAINSCKDSSLKVFFFTNNLIKNATQDSTMKNQLYSKKVILKVKDLEKLNWRIEYDGK